MIFSLDVDVRGFFSDLSLGYQRDQNHQKASQPTNEIKSPEGARIETAWWDLKQVKSHQSFWFSYKCWI